MDEHQNDDQPPMVTVPLALLVEVFQASGHPTPERIAEAMQWRGRAMEVVGTASTERDTA